MKRSAVPGASRTGRPSPRVLLRGVEWARQQLAIVAGVTTVAMLVAAAPAHADVAAPSGPTASAGSVTVVVTPATRPDPYNGTTVGDPGATAQKAAARTFAMQAVRGRVGLMGRVTNDLPAVSGVVATVTPDQLALLKSQPDLVVTPDVSVSVADASMGSATRAPAAVFPQTTGASQLWANGIDGRGVTVAVLDTGITPLRDFGDRLLGGVDLSGEGNPLRDSYGHGTFVAGLIAGNGASSNGLYMGEAPKANLVAVKVAGASGVTDLATVISGINWVVAHRGQYGGIRVLNISLGAMPTSSTVLNPLDQAVETAWQAGITVVVSAGNAGPFNGTILSPGDDPLAITVGALDDNGSTNPAAATMTTFSSVGPTSFDGWFKPDLVTSGRSVVSLRAPGSTIDTQNPSAVIGTSNFVGSGTSFSTAITSGAAALISQGLKNKNVVSNLVGSLLGSSSSALTPAQVKAQLLGTTSAGPVGNPMVDGHGALNAYAAVTQPGLQLAQTVPSVATPAGSTIDLGATWNGSSWNGSSWNGSSWSGSSWNGSSWNGSSWSGSSWNGSSWNGSSWSGSSWSGSSWNGSSWNSSSWSGSSWNGSSWSGSSWSGSSWNGSSWNGASWSGSSWS